MGTSKNISVAAVLSVSLLACVQLSDTRTAAAVTQLPHTGTAPTMQPGPNAASEEQALYAGTRALQASGVDPDSFYFDRNQKLNVVVGSIEQAHRARVSGVTPHVESWTYQSLDQVRKKILGMDPSNRYVRGTIVNIETGRVEIDVIPDGTTQYQRFSMAATGLGAELKIDSLAQKPQSKSSSVGGWTMEVRNFRCTTGFNAIIGNRTVMVTAGHCALPLGQVRSVGGHPIGKTISSRYQNRGYDYGLIDYDPTVSTPPVVADRQGGSFTIKGIGPGAFAQGQAICKFGITTGRTCGYIQDSHGTENRGGGVTLYDIAISSVCSDTGDSGSPITIGSTAVGVLGGGRYGKCGYNSGYRDTLSFGTTFQTMKQVFSYYGGYVKTG